METLALAALGSSAGAGTAGLFGAGGSFSLLSTAGTLATGLSTVSSIQAGRQQSAVYKAQARQAELQARNTLLQGRQQSLAIKEQLNRDVATQAAGFAARGVLSGEGSALAAMEQSKLNASRDIEYAMYGANMGYYQGNAQAAQYRTSASASTLSGYTNAVNTLTRSKTSILEDYLK